MMKINLLKYFTLVFLFNCQILFSQYQEENEGYFKNPISSGSKVIAADNFGSALYFIENSSIKEIISNPGIGNYYSISKDFSKLGVKFIEKDGLQIPALINIDDYSIVHLTKPVKQCGQVSFSNEGKIAFTIGTKLIVVYNNAEQEFELDVYSNIAPISPDGKFAAFNDLKDQIWILNLETSEKQKISDNKLGYFNPVWSNDSKTLLYSGLNGTIFTFSLQTSKNYFIDEGSEPKWSLSGNLIVYYKKEIIGQELVNSDLFLSSSAGKNILQLTDTKNIFEMDPSFFGNDEQIIYHTYGTKEINSIDISQSKNILNNKIVFAGKEVRMEPLSINSGIPIEAGLNIPYVHQVYDTPDWHNGHWSCAPTAAIMVLAYYNILPKWESWCSYPSPGHKSYFGKYVAERYYYFENDYRFTAGDAGGYPTQGGYGFMWSSGSPYSKMRDYYAKHKISSVQDNYPNYTKALNEINQNYPYTMCVMLTTSGHLIISKGLYSDHTIIFNDPYGNKNSPGYPSYDGKDVMYDWPGYNNGFQNLNGVAWCITNHKTLPAAADTLIDDLQFDNGFYLHTKYPSSMDMWKDFAQGYNGHFWFRKTNSNYPNDTCFAVWTPTLSKSGKYKISAYIPFSNSEEAVYKIFHNDVIDSISINQSLYTNEWVSIGEYALTAGTGNSVKLGDGSTIPNQEIVFDAVKFEYQDSITTSVDHEIAEHPDEFMLYQNYPNPFNPTTRIEFYLPIKSYVELKVFDALGNTVEELFSGVKSSGKHSFEFSGTELSSGVYLVQLKTNSKLLISKILLLK